MFAASPSRIPRQQESYCLFERYKWQVDGHAFSLAYSLKNVGRDGIPPHEYYTVINSGCFCECTHAGFACMDHGPVHVTVTGRIWPFKSSSNSTKTSLLVGVRPFQRFLTLSSNKTSTVWPR